MALPFIETTKGLMDPADLTITRIVCEETEKQTVEAIEYHDSDGDLVRRDVAVTVKQMPAFEGVAAALT